MFHLENSVSLPFLHRVSICVQTHDSLLVNDIVDLAPIGLPPPPLLLLLFLSAVMALILTALTKVF